MKFQILRLPQVKSKVGLSKSTIYARIAAGTFPGQIATGPNCVGWIEAQLDDWISEQILTSREEKQRRLSSDGKPFQKE